MSDTPNNEHRAPCDISVVDVMTEHDVAEWMRRQHAKHVNDSGENYHSVELSVSSGTEGTKAKWNVYFPCSGHVSRDTLAEALSCAAGPLAVKFMIERAAKDRSDALEMEQRAKAFEARIAESQTTN